ncbi:MAG: sulfite exporter TauE/SafE family protein [Burkholderiaceae bacterium]
MQTSLALTALLMGLAGGPHCAAMCGAACTGIGRAGPAPRSMRLFHAGRLLGYSLAGGLAAAAIQSLAWLTEQAGVLRPVWTLFHVAVLAWGLALLAFARQPVWVEGLGRSVWARVRPLAAARGGVFSIGMLWALMPCGLLYSALLVAALSSGPLEGALAMALFAAGSTVSLALGPWLWRKLRANLNQWRQDWGTRTAGLLLCAVAGWALWMDLAQRVAAWCQ